MGRFQQQKQQSLSDLSLSRPKLGVSPVDLGEACFCLKRISQFLGPTSVPDNRERTVNYRALDFRSSRRSLSISHVCSG